MSSKLTTISPEDSLLSVQEIFKKEKFHHLPVLDKGELVGIISKSDFLHFKRGFVDRDTDNRLDLFRLKKWKVNQIMTTGLAKMDHDERINVALDIFRVNMFHAIPIMEDQKLVGILTTYDIINHLARDKSASTTYST